MCCLFEFFTIRVSVRLSDRSSYREEQKQIRQKFPPVGVEPRTSGSSLPHSVDCARQVGVEHQISEVSFASCSTSHVGLVIISGITRTGLYKGLNDSHRQQNTDPVGRALE